eukprot:155525-Chlamydomonas_euryale.AAC.1
MVGRGQPSTLNPKDMVGRGPKWGTMGRAGSCPKGRGSGRGCVLGVEEVSTLHLVCTCTLTRQHNYTDKSADGLACSVASHFSAQQA